MKRMFSLAKFVFAFLIISTAVKAQDVSINVISQEGGTNDGSWALNATGTTILVTVCNEDFVTFLDTPAYKLRPLISVPGAIVQLAPNASQTGLPAGWTILSNNGNSIRLSNGTDTFAPGECRDIALNVIPTTVGGPLTVTATLAFSNGVAPGSAVGTQTPGNNPSNDNSTTAIVITAPVTPPVATDDNAGTTSVPVAITVLTNDTPGSAPIDPTKVMLIDPATNSPSTNVTIPGEGSYVVNPTTGVVTFTPEAGLTTPVTSTIKYTITDTNGQTSNQATITVVALPLPVTLTVFKVTKEGKIARLNWETTEETNSDHFEIQHSISGKDWNKIGTVDSHGDSKVRNVYSFTDINPANGENLYRLKMIDRDATFAYSRIQSVKFDGLDRTAVSVYPNPSVDKVFIQDMDLAQVKQVSILDMNGRALFSSNKVSADGINVSKFTPGTYILHVTNVNGTVSNHKIVIAR